MNVENKKISELNIELIDGDRGKNYPKNEEIRTKGYCLFLNAKNVTSNDFNFNELNYISEEKDKLLRNGKLKRKDIILTTRGTVGNVAYYSNKIPYENMRINSGMIIIRCSEDLNEKYLYWYMRSKMFQNQIKELQTGSAQPQLPISIIKNMNIQLCKKQLQSKIVKVLDIIQQKIDLNTHTNNNLYKILDNIFKEKYLNNERYDLWEEVTLDDITSKFATGLNPRKNFVLGHGSNYYVTIKNMQNNDVILNDKCNKVDDEAILKINKRSDLKVGDLLFSGIGTIGRVYLIKDVPNNWNISESIFTIRPNKKCSSEFLYLLLLNKKMQNYAVNKASGSVQKGIRMADLKQFKLKLPTDNEMQSFTDVIKPIIDRIYNKTKQIEKLEQIRNTLLPKLMNGEIDLDKIEI